MFGIFPATRFSMYLAKIQSPRISICGLWKPGTNFSINRYKFHTHTHPNHSASLIWDLVEFLAKPAVCGNDLCCRAAAGRWKCFMVSLDSNSLYYHNYSFKAK